jgi:hypothetical protein
MPDMNEMNDIDRLAAEAEAAAAQPPAPANGQRKTRKKSSTHATAEPPDVEVIDASTPPEPDLDTEIEPEPAAAPDRKTRKTRKATGKAKPRAAQSKILKMMPDAEYVKVFKVDAMGTAHYITRWGMRELESHKGDIESLVQHYMVPVHGPGEYRIHVMNAAGEKVREFPVGVLQPNGGQTPQQVQQGQMIGQVPNYYEQARSDAEKRADRLEDKADALEAEIRQVYAHQPSMMDQLAEAQQVMETMGVGKDDPMKTMMMMKMFQQPQGNTQAEQQIAALRQEIRELRQQAAVPPPPPPLPPPPPPEQVNIGEVIAATSQMFAQSMIAAKPDLDIPTLLTLLKPADNSTELMSLRQEMQRVQEKADTRMFEMLRSEISDLKSGAQQGGFSETIEQMQQLLGFVKSANRNEQNETFWGFLNNVVGNLPKSLESVTDLMDKIRENQPEQQPQLTDGQAQEQPKKEAPLQFPADFPNHVAKIEDATDDATRVGATMQAFMHLGQQAGWRKYLKEIISKAKGDNKEEVIGFLNQFLGTLGQRQLLSQGAVKETMAAFDRQYETVSAYLKSAG